MKPYQAWQAALGQLQMDMTKAAYDTWVRHAEFVEYQDRKFIIGVANAYVRDWLDSRLGSTVTRLLSGLMGELQQVEFIIWNRDSKPQETAFSPAAGAWPEPAAPAEAGRPAGSETIIPRYTFSSFVVGSSNRLAQAACLAVTDNPARAYNPLFLYGGVGLGKTHLLHAIGNAALQRGQRAMYVSSEEFTNDLVSAIRTHTTAEFRERYRGIDLLLIDDIQFLAGKESTQEEFFHTFNALHGMEKQIVICSDRPPKALVTLEERLRSRFEWGLIVDIQPPDVETRLAILQAKADTTGRDVPPVILENIARLIHSNIRELEGALNRVLAFSELSGHPLTPALVHSALVDLLPRQDELDTEQILRVVAGAFGIHVDELTGRSRAREVALPRQVAMYLMREEKNESLPQIGEALGGRDHTTVMYACDKIASLIENDDRLRRQVGRIREKLYNR